MTLDYLQIFQNDEQSNQDYFISNKMNADTAIVDQQIAEMENDHGSVSEAERQELLDYRNIMQKLQ